MHRLRDYCYKLYWKLESKLVPGLRNSQYIYADKLSELVPTGGRWLELGCGHQILPSWMGSAQATEKRLVQRPTLVVGLDPTFSSLQHHQTIAARVVALVEHLPFQSGYFDLVTANMVMEHIGDPASALREIHRILGDHGLFLFHTTNVKNYKFAASRFIPQRLKNKLIFFLEGRAEEDVFPTTYKINTVSAIEETARAHGFEVLELLSISSTAATAVIPPLAFFELLVIRLLAFDFAAKYRSNLIVVLRKQR